VNQRNRVRRLAAATALAATGAIVLAGCSTGTADTTIEKTAPSELTGTVSFWHFFSDREGDVIQSVVDEFEAANPRLTVEVHAGQDDEKLRKAIAAGNDVDLGLSYSTDIVGSFCASGAFRDLGPYIDRDDVDLTQYSDTVRSYTEFDGVRCSMPVLADVYGLYFNKSLLAGGGFSAPPTTLGELETMALALTTYNDDGSIKTLGFNPMMGFYENSAAHFGPLADTTWLEDDGTSAIGGDENWRALMEWQKDFVDEIGYDKLNAFTSGLGQEFSGDNAFQTGQIAMNLDGEYRTAFIDDQAPDLDYGTAPMPVADDQPDLLGAGYITGNIAGISKGSRNPEAAWALLKYLTTDTDAIVSLSNGLKNVPTTEAALASPDLEVSEQFQTFLDIIEDPDSATTPPSPVGAGYQQSFEDFWQRYQSSAVDDLEKGLTGIDQEIDDALSLTTGP
jgi:multiple sugar transport system substrate-binding protein